MVDILSLIKDGNAAFKAAYKKFNSRKWTEAKRLRTRIKLAINNRPAGVVKRTFHPNRGNPHAFWDTVNKLLGKGKNTGQPLI